MLAISVGVAPSAVVTAGGVAGVAVAGSAALDAGTAIVRPTAGLAPLSWLCLIRPCALTDAEDTIAKAKQSHTRAAECDNLRRIPLPYQALASTGPFTGAWKLDRRAPLAV